MSLECVSVCVCPYVTLFPHSISPEILNGYLQNFQPRPTLTQQTIWNPTQPTNPYSSLLYLTTLPYPT